MTVPTQPVTIRLADFGGASIAGVTVTARLTAVDYTPDGTFVSTEPVTGVTNALGEVTLQLFPNALVPLGLGTTGSRVRVTAAMPSSRQLKVEAVIPNEPCSLAANIVNQEPIGLAGSELAAANALASQKLAKQWATQTTAEVEAGQGYGAKKYAEDAAADQAQTTADRLQTGLDRAATAADRVSTAANALSAANSQALASVASSNAALVTAAVGAYPNAAKDNVPRGLTQSSVGTITAGAGGTNGTFNLGFSAGTGWLIYPTGTFTVAGGGVTAVTITGPGLNIHAAPVVPTVSFAASAGLTGAAVALTMQFLVTSGQGYWVQSVDLQTIDRYKNVTGTATRDTSVESIATAAATGKTVSSAVPGAAYAIQDSNDNAAEYLDSTTGKRYAVALDVDSINGFARSEITRAVRRGLPNLTAAYVAHISYGQSLSVGANAQIHSRPDVDGGFFDCVRFNANGSTTAGPRAQEGSGTVAQNHASFVAYEEQFNASSLGETPLGNALRTVKRLLRDEDGVLPATYDYILVGSAPGQSNTTIASLSKGGTYYQRVIDDVTYGLQLALAQGKSYAVDVIYWSQGEADMQAGTTRAAYLAAFQQLYTDLNTDIKALTKQAHDLKIIAYQMSVGTQTSNTIALAQLDAAKANPNIIIATASYAMEHFAATDAHLTGFGYASLGAYYGLAAKRVIVDRETWPLLYPSRLTRQGAILEFEMPDTGYPWTISNTLFPTVANSGFTAVRTDGTTDNPITSVTVVGPRRVRVVLTFAESGKLRYGFSSWGGNLHDTTDIDPGTAATGVLYRPCLTFEEPYA